MGRGALTAAQSGALGPAAYGLSQFLDAPQQSQVEEQAYAALQKRRPTSTFLGEIAGEAIPFILPGMQAGALPTAAARIAGTTALGALETGLPAVGRGEDAASVIQQGGVGGAVAGTVEAVLPVFGRLVGEAVRNVTGRTAETVLDASGNVVPQVRRLLEAQGVNVDEIKSQAVKLVMEDPRNLEEATRMARFRQQGVPFTPGDISGDFTQRAKEARLSEVQDAAADLLRNIRTGQAKRIDELRTELAQRVGVLGVPETGELTKEAVELAENIAKGSVKYNYKALAEAAGYSDGMPLPLDTFGSVFQSPSFFGQVQRLTPTERQQIQNTLVEFGIDSSGDAVEQFMRQSEPGIIGRKPQITSLTTENQDRFVQALNSIITPTSSNELRAVTGQLKNAANSALDLLDDGVGAEVQALSKQARLSNVALKQDFSPKRLARKIIATQNDRFTPVVENSRVYAALFSKATPTEQFSSTLDILRRTEKGKSAIGALQGRVIMDAFDAGMLPSSRMNGQLMVSGNAVQKYLDNVIGQDKLQDLFKDSPHVFDDFLSLVQTAVDITPSAKETVKGSGSVIINMMNQLAELTMANKLGPVAALLNTVTKAARGGADEREIQRIINRSPQLKKQAEYIQQNLPRLSAAVGLGAASAAAQEDSTPQ